MIKKTNITAIIACVLVIFAFGSVNAHFLLNLNVRIFHVEHFDGGARIYMRMPMPYLVAGLIGPVGENGLPRPAPFTTNRMENGKLVHYVNVEELRANPDGLGHLAADGYALMIADSKLPALVEATRVHLVKAPPGFATLKEARAAFANKLVYPEGEKPAYVGDALVDVILRYNPGKPIYAYTFSSTLDPGLPGQDETANVILDYSAGETNVFRARGLLSTPVNISRSSMSAISTFIGEGVRHILGGIDHVLFVLCLVLGASGMRALAWRVTGFTIGHSITLTLGFFGFVPQGAWFIPAIETGIALSIIYAAVMVFGGEMSRKEGERRMFIITTAIGLLHGLGFSFVLHNLLRVDSPDLWQSLLAFNVGVEIGQLAIILIVWPVFYLLGKLNSNLAFYSRRAVAATCMAIAAYWSLERMASLIQTF